MRTTPSERPVRPDRPTGRFRRYAVIAGFAVLAVGAPAGCGEDSDSDSAQTTTTSAPNAPDLAAIKTYLLDHTERLKTGTTELQAAAQAYYDLAKSEDFDYRKLASNPEAQALIERGQKAWTEANPAYEEAEGIVAGVPSLAQYDVILDAGGTGDDPENAVPFDINTPDGRTLEQPGNFFFVTETSLFGTNPDFTAKGAKLPNGDPLPDANVLVAAAQDFNRNVEELDASAKAWKPTESDVLSALVIMTPTMSEYFEQWKNSQAIAGDRADELGFVGASRLSDITSILDGLVFAYDEVEPLVAKADPEQAAQTQRELVALRDFARKLRDEEAGGKKFNPEQADTLGAEAQRQAEAIAGQISQAAAKLNIELEEA